MNWSIGSALKGYNGRSAAGLSYSDQNSFAIFHGIMKSRPATFGRTHISETRAESFPDSNDESGLRMVDQVRRYRIAAKSGFCLPEGLKAGSLVSKKQSTCRRASAAFSI